MPNISLAKALKVKNRLTGRLNKTTETIQSFNSVLETQANDVDVTEQLKMRDRIKDALITLKTAIYHGNSEIQQSIYTLGEAKSEIAFYGCVSTHDGVQPHSYQNTPVKYVATLKRADVDAKLAQLENTIDQLQDKLDEYNHSTKIEVPQEVLDLAS